MKIDIMHVLTRARGRLTGNHTYSHIQLTKSNKDVFKEEQIKTNEILKEIIGEDTVCAASLWVLGQELRERNEHVPCALDGGFAGLEFPERRVDYRENSQ